MKKVLYLIMLALALPAAAQRFDFSASAALNLCQIDGDHSAHYNKLGYRAGVNSSFQLGDSDFRFAVEVGVSQKGSHITYNGLDRRVATTYIEVPLMLCYNFNRLRIGAGIAPAFLGKAVVKDSGIPNDEIAKTFRRMDIAPFVTDIQYLFTDHLGIDARWYNSLLPVAEGNSYRFNICNHGAFHRLLSIGVTCRF